MDKQKSEVILSSAYFAPIQYFTKLVSYKQIYLEHCESYLKQSYRNRTIILAANGPLVLSVPVADGPRAKGPITDLKLSYDQPWQQVHWRGIASAYNNSPFYEYYSDDLAPYFHEKKWKFLFDFNTEILHTLLKLMNIQADIQLSERFFSKAELAQTMDDFRYAIHPKPAKQDPDQHFFPERYTQVFEDRWDFVPNLSILDLLFNEGPETINQLRKCIR